MSQHPVDVLKDLGMPMSPKLEAEMRALCDETLSGAAHCAELYQTWRRAETGPRVITRVMDDGVQTKDGAA